MKRASFACLFLGLTTTLLWSQSNPIPLINPTASVASPGVVSSGVVSSGVVPPGAVSSGVVSSIRASDPKAQARILEGYGKLPLSFEANQGQADARVKFLSRTGGYTLFLTGDEAVLALRGKAKNRRADAVGHVAKGSSQGLKPASLATSAQSSTTGTSLRGTAEPASGPQSFVSQSFVSGHRFSGAVSSAKSEAPLGAARRDHPATDRTSVLRMKLRHANPAAKVTGADQLAGTSNYFIGNDPAKWRTNVPTYAKVKYEGIYPGIDLVYYGNQRQLEYDFIVAPGADPRRIAFDVRGAKQIRQDARGDLVLKTSAGEIRWHKPVVYQEKNGARQEIAARYAITAANRVGFELAKYDASRPLYIDPLIYSTYLGGSSNDYGYGIAVDSAGNAYVTGYTHSNNFPVAPGAFQPTCGGNDCSTYGDVFVSKINATGSALVYSSYLGGSQVDIGFGIAVDSAGDAYVTGQTDSVDFPVTPGAFQTVCNGGSGCNEFGDAFVSKLNPTGSALIYSTYLGGSSSSDDGFGIAVDSAGNAYVVGTTASTNFPVTPGAFQTACGSYCSDAFVTKLNPTGSALIYSTYLGGNYLNEGFGIAVDNSGNAYVTGYTWSTDFPTTPGAFQTACGGAPYPYNCWDAFVTKFNPTGSALVYSTYLGGSSYDLGFGIAVDSAGNAYVIGGTCSTDFPTMNPLQPAYGGASCISFVVGDAFVTKFNPTGSALVYSSYLGGSGYDNSTAIAIDSSSNIYVTGWTESTDFPVTPGAFQTTCGGGSGCGTNNGNTFMAKISPTGSALVYSTYLGGSGGDAGYGIAIDSSGKAYVTGATGSANFPVTPAAFQLANGGGGDAFVAKISSEPSDVTLFPLHLDFGSQSIGIASSPQASTLTNTGNDTLTITSISVIGGESEDFVQTNNCGTSVPPSASCSITVTFTPTAKGNRSATVNIADSAPDSPQSLVLTGVGLLDTTTKLTSSADPSRLGKAVTFTATVSSPSGGTPTGSVSFLDGGTVLASTALSGGTGSFTTKKLPLGLNIITASYSGDSNYGPSTSAPLNQYVLETTTTTLSSLPNPSIYGQAVTFTAVVTSSLGAPPDGEIVTFRKGTKILGTGTLSGGSASFTTSTLNAGTPLIKAVYGGDSTFAASTSKALSQVVNKATTTTTLVSSENPSNFGQAVTFTASVAPQFSGTVTGTVTFYDGTTALKKVLLNGGVAKFTTSTLAKGTHTITATYNGNANFLGSSASLTQTVN
jgi:hypothetical protein